MRLAEQALIVRQLAFVLGFQDLIGAWIDLRQKIAFLHHLPFLEGDLGQLTVDLGLHGDGGERRDGAERIDQDADIVQRDGCGADRLKPGLLEASGGRLRRQHPARDLVGAKSEPDRNDQPNANTEL